MSLQFYIINSFLCFCDFHALSLLLIYAGMCVCVFDLCMHDKREKQKTGGKKTTIAVRKSASFLSKPRIIFHEWRMELTDNRRKWKITKITNRSSCMSHEGSKAKASMNMYKTQVIP